MIRFSVPAIPVAQPRQRHRVMATGGKSFVQNFTPAKHPVQAFKATVRLAATQQHSGPPLEGPLCIRMVFVLPRPGRLIWKSRPMPRAWHESKPDADNLSKAVKDALSGLLWRDDAQVACMEVRKVIASGQEQPGVEIVVEKLAPWI